MIGGGLDGAGADREAVESEGRVLHAVDAAGEVGAFDATGLGSLRGGGSETIEGREDRERAEGEEFALAGIDPGRCGGRVRETGRRRSGEVLGGVVEVTDLDPLVDVLVGKVPDPDRAIESSADHVVQRRMKRAGMRWSEAGADAILALRARLRSQRTLAA